MHRTRGPAAGLALLCAGAWAGPQDDWPPDRLGEFTGELAGLSAPGDAAWWGELLCVSERDAHRLRLLRPDGSTAELGERGSGPGQFVRPTGLAVGDDGQLWVADTGNHRLQRFDAEGEPLDSLGERGSGAAQLCAPTGLDVDAHHLVVADTGNDRVQVWSADGARPLSSLDWTGAPPLGLAAPSDVVLHPDGASVYVVDQGHHRVLHIGLDGEPLHSWGGFGPHTGLFARPAGIELAGERLYVAELENHRVQVFDLAGEPVYEWGLHAIRPREGEGKLHYPRAVAVHASGERAAVVEGLVDRVQMFGRAEGDPAQYMADPAIFGAGSPAHYGPQLALSGQLLLQLEPERQGLLLSDVRDLTPIEIGDFGGYGEGLTQLLDVRGLWLGHVERRGAEGREARAWVADAARARLLEFRLKHTQGETLRFDATRAEFLRAVDLEQRLRLFDALPEGGVRPGPLTRASNGWLYVVDEREGQVLVLDGLLVPQARLGARHELDRASALALDEEAGLLWVADELGGRVLALPLDGGPARALLGPEQVARPSGLALDAEGRLWVSDAARHQLSLWSPEGELVRQRGGPGLRAGEFYKPRGLSFDGAGRLFVSDHGNHRGILLDAQGHFLGAFGPRLYVRPTREG